MFAHNGRPILRPVPTGQSKKFRSAWCYYNDGRLHPECAPQLAALCGLCRSKSHKRHAGAACRFCVEKAKNSPYWYQSCAEAENANRLDNDLKRGRIKWWRRANTVVLLDAMPGQAAITYTADLVWCALDGQIEVLEVKSWPTLTKDSRNKIKWYRSLAVRYGWPPLRVVNRSGQTMRV